jgi:hypothetical protein
MRSVDLTRFARALALLIAVALTPGTAMAGGHERYGWRDRPSGGYAVPIQAVYQFPSVLANQPTTPWGYAVPIQGVYQLPAVMANQPGAEVSFLWSDPTRGLLGGQPYLYHP